MKLDDEGWLDEPSNRKKLIRWFYWLCGLVILADLIFSLGWHKHAAFAEEKPFYSLETLPAFYGIFGFEFATITLLSLIVAVHLGETEKFI